MPQFATYSRFYSPEDAQFLITLLQQRNIAYSLEHEVNQLDKVYLGDSIDPMFALRIPAEQFSVINNALAEQAKTDMATPGFEHMMQSYSTEELREIVNDPSGWNAYDLQVAASLLAEKTHGEVIIPAAATKPFVPYNLPVIWRILGYVVCILGTFYIIYLALAGFMGGLVINQATKTLKDGTTVKMYSPESRRHGRNLMIFGALCICISLLLIYGVINPF